MKTNGGTLAITMAGFGRRFTEAGHQSPKYSIDVLGRPLFDWAIISLKAFLDAGWSLSFAARAGERAPDFINGRAAALGFSVGELLELAQPTDGQATTALHLASAARQDEPFAIFNIDTFVAPGAMKPSQIPIKADGWVPCFEATGDCWSFARTGKSSKILELREKQRISPFATLGFYWFSSARLYQNVYRGHFARGQGMEMGEKYIAPMYNYMIAAGQSVFQEPIAVSDTGLLGTPEQVELFKTTPPPSAMNCFHHNS